MYATNINEMGMVGATCVADIAITLKNTFQYEL